MCYHLVVLRGRRRCFAGAERGSRVSQFVLNPFCDRMRAAEHTPRDPFCLLKRRHGLAQIVERGAVVSVERPPVKPPEFERIFIAYAKNSSRHGHHFAQE